MSISITNKCLITYNLFRIGERDGRIVAEEFIGVPAGRIVPALHHPDPTLLPKGVFADRIRLNPNADCQVSSAGPDVFVDLIINIRIRILGHMARIFTEPSVVLHVKRPIVRLGRVEDLQSIEQCFINRLTWNAVQ